MKLGASNFGQFISKIVLLKCAQKAEIDLTDDDVAGLLHQRAHTVPHSEIVRALYERVADVSSTLRARALGILSDCLLTHEAPLSEAIQVLSSIDCHPVTLCVFFSFLENLQSVDYTMSEWIDVGCLGKLVPNVALTHLGTSDNIQFRITCLKFCI